VLAVRGKHEESDFIGWPICPQPSGIATLTALMHCQTLATTEMLLC
jgi:hypothetical protein